LDLVEIGLGRFQITPAIGLIETRRFHLRRKNALLQIIMEEPGNTLPRCRSAPMHLSAKAICRNGWLNTCVPPPRVIVVDNLIPIFSGVRV
jgi:hypothetical protein